MKDKKLKVMVIGSDYRWYNESLKKCFEENNCDVVVYNSDVSIRKTDYFVRVKRVLGFNISKYSRERINEESKTIFDEFLKCQPDIVFVRTGEQLNAEVVKKMSSTSTTVLYLADSLERYPVVKNTVSFYSMIYSFEKTDIEKLKKNSINAKVLMGTVDRNQYYPQKFEKKIDVSFVGAMYDFRLKILRRLYKDLPDVSFEFHGIVAKPKNIIKYLRFMCSNDRKVFSNKEIHYSQVNELYSKSKICLNLQHPQSQDGWNSRLCEILGTKSFQLVNINPSIEEEFENGLETFKTYDEMKAKIEIYLEDVKKREQIAQNGYNTILQKHTTLANVRQILKDIKYNSTEKEGNQNEFRARI